MKIKKFNSEGHSKWIEFYNELFLEIKNVSKGSKISPEDIKKGYNETFREKYELIKNSKNLSEELDKSKNFEIKNFNNSYELAKSVNSALSDYDFYLIDRSEIWDWIAMTLFDQIFVPGFAYKFISLTKTYGIPKPLLSEKHVYPKCVSTPALLRDFIELWVFFWPIDCARPPVN